MMREKSLDLRFYFEMTSEPYALKADLRMGDIQVWFLRMIEVTCYEGS